MPLVVNTNTQSLFAQRALSANTMGLQKSTERLSTGFRINKAADDAAGLTISQKMTANIRGLEKASQNAGDGISLLQTAEGALGVIQDNLQRVRELKVQADNGTNGTDELNAIQSEINERITTIDQIAQATKFNGNNLIYNAASVTLQTGSDAGQTTTIALADGGAVANTGVDINIDAEALAATNAEHGQLAEGATDTFALNKLHVGGGTLAQDGTIAVKTGTLGDLDAMIDNVSRMRSSLGAVQNGLESKLESLDVAKENLSASRSRIMDTDIASESSKLVKSQILQQASAAMLSQANQGPQIALSLLP